MKKQILIILIILLSIINTNAIAQTSSKKNNASFPVALVLGSFLLDNTIRDFARNNQSTFSYNIARIDRFYGDPKITAISLLSLYGLGLTLNNDKFKEVTETAILSAVVTTAITAGLKELTGRARPHKGLGNSNFKPFTGKESRRSFPSGHASATFAISTIFADAIDNSYWKSFWYGSAVLVGGARIYKDQHWFSDVVFSSALGYFIAKKTQALFKKRKANPVFGLAFIDNKVLLTAYLNL